MSLSSPDFAPQVVSLEIIYLSHYILQRNAALSLYWSTLESEFNLHDTDHLFRLLQTHTLNYGRVSVTFCFVDYIL